MILAVVGLEKNIKNAAELRRKFLSGLKPGENLALFG